MAQDKSPQVYELRTLTLAADKLPALDAYLEKALIPAVTRHGAGPVGVFTETESTDRDILSGKQTTTTLLTGKVRVFVLIVHPGSASVGALASQLETDEAYQQAAKPFLAALPTEPVVLQQETALFLALPGMPTLERPDRTKPRLFNLRTYASHNDRAAAKKREMFQAGGELAIFRRVGLTPVFFASSLAGPAMPNLTYLLVFPDDAGRTEAWGRFVKDPAWVKLKAEPGFADKEILSGITNRLLTPRPYSEL